MKKGINRNFHLSQAFSLFRYTGDALIFAFLALFFQSLNFNSWMTGTLLASVPIMAIVGNIVMGALSKSVKFNLLLMKIIMPIEIFFTAIIGFMHSFPLVLICSICMNFCNSSFYSLLDGLANDVSQTASKNYVAIRVMGSIAYLISSFSGGYIIDALNFGYTFLIAAIIWAIGYILLYFYSSKLLSQDYQKKSEKESYKYLFTNKTFLIYIGFYILVLSMSNITDNFFALYAKEVRNMSTQNYGIVFSSMVLTEIITILIFLKVKIKDNKFWLTLASSFLLLRVFLLCFDLPDFMLYIIPLFRGIGWGMILSFHVNTLKTFVAKPFITKAIFILTIGLQTINALFNQFGPSIVSITSYNQFFSVLFAMGSVGLVIFSTIHFGKNSEDLSFKLS